MPCDLKAELVVTLKYLDMSHNVFVHVLRHFVHIVVGIVVHDCVRKHEHHVSLELGSRSDFTIVNLPLDLL